MTSEEYQVLRKQKGWIYNKVVKNAQCPNLKYINPIKQEEVETIYQAALKDPNIEKIIVFGSAARWDCHQGSDLDLCFKWKMPAWDKDYVLVPETKALMKVASKCTHGNVDIVQWDDMDHLIVKDGIEKDGVVIYE